MKPKRKDYGNLNSSRVKENNLELNLKKEIAKEIALPKKNKSNSVQSSKH